MTVSILKSVRPLRIQADLSNAVDRMVSVPTPISSSSRHLTTHLEIVPSALIIIDITVTLRFHHILFSAKVQVLVSPFVFFGGVVLFV